MAEKKKTCELIISDFKNMPEDHVIQLAKKYPYKSLWKNKDAFEYVLSVLMRIKGRRYMQSGNPTEFYRKY